MAATPSSDQEAPVPVLMSFFIVCRGRPAVAALPHVASKADAFLLDLSPEWTLQQATDSGFVYLLLDRLLTQEWEGLSPGFRRARFERCVERAIDPAKLDVLDCRHRFSQAQGVAMAVRPGKLPLDHSSLSEGKTCYSSEAARWILEHVEDAFLTLCVNSEADLELVKWADDQEERGACDSEDMDNLMDNAVRKGNMEIVRWIHSNRSELCAYEALGEAVANGHLNMAKWLYADYPEEYFDDPWKAACDLDIIKWVEYKWKEEDHRVVWIDNTILNVSGQDQNAVSPERDLKIVSFLYSVRSDIDREAHLRKVMPPLPSGAGYRTVPRYFPLKLIDAMDTAACVGNLQLRQWFHVNRNDGCTTYAMNEAAAMGHLDVVQWLHENREEGCTVDAMSRAIGNNQLEVVQWLHTNRSEGYKPTSMDTAARFSYLEMLKRLHANRSEGCTFQAMNYAAHAGNFEVVKWLHENRSEGCSDRAIDYAADKGRLDIIEYLHTHLQEGCIDSAIENAARHGHVDVMKWLIDNHLADSRDVMNAFHHAAVFAANLESAQFLAAYCKLDYDSTLVNQAAAFRRFDVVEWLLRYAHANGKTMQCPLAKH